MRAKTQQHNRALKGSWYSRWAGRATHPLYPKKARKWAVRAGGKP